MRTADVLWLVRDIRRRLDGDLSLTRLARRAGWSPYHLQREFRRAVGETPKQYTQRLRLERAAAGLLVRAVTIENVARASGFASHEVFTRAFRRYFGCSPVRYRTRALAGASALERARHLALTESVGPCIRLFRFPTRPSKTEPMMPTLSITRQERAAQPVLFIRRRITRDELPGMLAECFGTLYSHGQKAGLPIAGFPLARYVSTGPGLWTVDAAIPLATPAASEGEMQADSLPAGPVAMAVHAGPYDQLPETHVALERWIDANGFKADGPPWEWYVNDPGEYPNPADWRTEVYRPLAP